MKALFFLLAWQVNAAGAANKASAEIVEMLQEGETAENQGMVNEEAISESEEFERRENSSEVWDYGKPNRQGPARRRFIIAYYPDQRKGITTNMWGRGGRRRHWAISPHWFQNNKNARKQDMEWLPKHGGGHKIYNRASNKCLDSHGGHEDDLYWHSCHNGGNQHFWFETWGGDHARKAFHIHIGGNMKNRRRHACLDYGGGRLYIWGCHNGDNQRWRWKYATTTTSTSTTTTTTTKVSVRLVTASFPEKMSWKIEDITDKKKVKNVCNGKGFTTWYAETKLACQLTKGRLYKVTCMDKMYKEGWAGGYMSIGKRKVCKNWAWDAGKSSTSVTLRAPR